MAIWGINNGSIDENRLKKFGLYCYGGKDDKYIVHSFNSNIELVLTQNEFDNIEEYMKKLRKKKLETL